MNVHLLNTKRKKEDYSGTVGGWDESDTTRKIKNYRTLKKIFFSLIFLIYSIKILKK